MYDKRVKFLHDILDFLISLVRLIGTTHFRATHKIDRKSEKCIVMGNGPSLLDSLEKNQENLFMIDLIGVNFMAITPEYEKYKPSIYVVCDPFFWSENISEEIMAKMKYFYSQLIKKTQWEIQLYMPHQAKNKKIESLLSQNTNINIYYYNKTKIECHKWLKHYLYSRQWGMPRAENVLVAAIMLAIYSDYKEIYIAGADSDYIRNFWIDEKNRLRIYDMHYYEGDNKDVIIPYRIDEICISSYYMFKSYLDINQYAVYRNIKIYNTGLYSFIDAFEKKNIIT
jgi:hypothetical protein